MSVFKRGKKGIYWVAFNWRGLPVRESTKQCSKQVAIEIENDMKAKMARGERGIIDHTPCMTIKDFIGVKGAEGRFRMWAKNKYEFTSKKTWNDWYRPAMNAIVRDEEFAKLALDQITEEHIEAFAARRHNGGTLAVNTVNSTLRMLKRVFRMAIKFKLIKASPLIEKLRGEKHRDYVVPKLDQAKYLAAAPELLCEVATILFDTGMRPTELYSLAWENINWEGTKKAKFGTLFIAQGKSAAARRTLPMTPKVRTVLETRWESAGKPIDGFVFPADTECGRITKSSLAKQEGRTFKVMAAFAKAHIQHPVKRFVLYSIRHTFLTRLGASGCPVHTLMRIAGHSSIAMSQRYVHPEHAAVLDAMEQLDDTVHGLLLPGKGVN